MPLPPPIPAPFDKNFYLGGTFALLLFVEISKVLLLLLKLDEEALVKGLSN